jgi:hypothetical protein
MIWSYFEIRGTPLILLTDANTQLPEEVPSVVSNVATGLFYLLISGTIISLWVWGFFSLARYIEDDHPLLARMLRVGSVLPFFVLVLINFFGGSSSISLSTGMVGMVFLVVLTGIVALVISLGHLVRLLFDRVRVIRIGSKKIRFDRKEHFTDQQLKEIVAATEEVRNAKKEHTSND